MKISKLLNRSYLSILLIIFLIVFNVKAEDEPVDIWNIDQNKIKESKDTINENNLKNSETNISQSNIFDL